jgi:nucleotide-binding universal stress UspA family protein
VLVAYDDSESAQRAIGRVIAYAARGLAFDLHLLNVQPPLRSDVTTFVPAANVHDFHREEGMKELAPAQHALDAAGLAHHDHVGVGSPADTIARVAVELDAELIVMGTHGRSAMAELLLGSVASGVVRAVSIPVTLVR